MLGIVGILVVIASVLGGYVAMGGHLDVLFQPFELVIIGGAAVGAFMVSTPTRVVKGVMGNLSRVVSGSAHGKSDYVELLTMLFVTFRLAKTKGDLALETHVEKPDQSPLFKRFPKFYKDKHALTFFCDYLRLLTMGSNNPHELELIIDEEIEALREEKSAISDALVNMADGLPALGIVAAVLGVIKTMGSISEPPEVLGHLIGAALVGTFLGVLLAYGFVGPIGRALAASFQDDLRYYHCMKTALLAHMQGYAPQIAVEFGRKILSEDVRPSFQEMDKKIAAVPQEQS